MLYVVQAAQAHNDREVRRNSVTSWTSLEAAGLGDGSLLRHWICLKESVQRMPGSYA